MKDTDRFPQSSLQYHSSHRHMAGLAQIRKFSFSNVRSGPNVSLYFQAAPGLASQVRAHHRTPICALLLLRISFSILAWTNNHDPLAPDLLEPSSKSNIDPVIGVRIRRPLIFEMNASLKRRASRVLSPEITVPKPSRVLCARSPIEWETRMTYPDQCAVIMGNRPRQCSRRRRTSGRRRVRSCFGPVRLSRT